MIARSQPMGILSELIRPDAFVRRCRQGVVGLWAGSRPLAWGVSMWACFSAVPTSRHKAASDGRPSRPSGNTGNVDYDYSHRDVGRCRETDPKR